jgi:type II secretory pathway component PulF
MALLGKINALLGHYQISGVREANTQATNDLKVQLGEFRGRTDNGLALAKWLGTFGATVFLSLMVYIFTVARSSGQLDQKIEALREQSER